jgi:hypothetical protein
MTGNSPLGPSGQPFPGGGSMPPTLVNAQGQPLTTAPAATAPAATAPTAPAATVDVGFFTKLKTVLNVAQATTKPAKFAAGMGWVAVSIDVLALLNMGNPFLFMAKAEDWVNRVSPEVSSTWADIQASYDSQILPAWQGDAQKALDTYLNKQIKPASDALKALSDQFATAMAALSSQVMTADFEAIAVGVASAILINSLFALDVATVGTWTPALVAAIIAYVVAVLAWLKGVGSIFEAFETQLTMLQAKANDVKAAIWADANRRNPSRIALDPAVTAISNINDTYWKHNPTLGTP